MAARSTCSCSITFAGFPIPVRMFPVLDSRKSASFKMLDPTHHAPVSQVLIDIDGERVERAATVKGTEIGSTKAYAVLTDEALELIAKVERSGALDVERFAPVASIPLDLALDRFHVVPDEKVPGSDQPVQILWNGLRKSDTGAVIPDWSPRAGAHPSTLVVCAIDTGLRAYLLPFASELKTGLPAFEPVENEKAAAMFAAVIEKQYKVENFDIHAYTDGYAERRAAAIALALSGEPVPADVKASKPAAAAPDLLAMLEASLAAPAMKAVA